LIVRDDAYLEKKNPAAMEILFARHPNERLELDL